jgi:hypothetical protein
LNATLELRNNFVAFVELGNEEGVELYILCCERPLFTLDVGVGPYFWDAVYFARKIMVSRKYYKVWHYNRLHPIPFHIPLQWKTQSGVGRQSEISHIAPKWNVYSGMCHKI